MKNNFIRRYFLFFSRHLVLYHLAIAILLALSFAGYSAIIGDPDLALPKWSWILFGVVVIHVVIAVYMTNKYISRCSDWSDYSDFLFCVLVTKDGQKIILDKPVWVKGEKYYVTRPRSYDRHDETWRVSTSVRGQYKNSTMSIPVELDFTLSRGLDMYEFYMKEIFELLTVDQEGAEYLSLDKYATHVFQKINAPNQGVIDKAVEKYSQLSISEPALLNEVIEVLIFPERLFSGVKDLKICLGNPKFSSCKGMACEK